MILKELELFQGIDYELIKEISDISVGNKYSKDDVIFNLGEKAERLFILEKGIVSLVIERGSGINYTLTHPGEVFGWSVMVDGGSYTATGVAASDLEVFEIEREKLNLAFNRHAKESLKVLKRLAGVISRRLMEAHKDLVSARGKFSEALE